ncbi:Retrovirus-related Pol polyprotein from transposon RE1 [Vitis vinifera]|uniref:Retrovirus-related Pol polyprotein from transposon RE1 n=1 Tax=Vitis vinifera TaxID=29760 RepID=A0A438CY37_VITVI|nr:Retrovirus-related Pol polyprotein from transposon RE1 [Vitis vinifera]
MTRKTMRNQGFEPWTFRSCLGYQHFVINDNNRDQWKKDSKKTSTATVAEIKTEANVDEKASALVAATDHGDRFHPLDLPHKKLFPQPMDIQTRQTIGCGIKRGKLYYLDFQSKDSNKLQQALMADGSEGEKKKSEIWLWHRRLGHASFDESRQSELVNQEAGELDMSGQQFGSEDVFTEIPNQSSSVEGVLNLEPDPFMKRLPHCHNRAIPNSVQEALADPRWKAAMNEEMKSLQKNETWELVECPPGKKPVGCHWIYTVKYKADGSIERFKARLDAWCQKAMLEGVQIEEVIVWVEAIPESMVWKETGMPGCQPVNTPIEEGLKLCIEPNQVSTDKGRYQRLVRRLMYLAHTRPNLAYALSVVSQYMHNPGEQHMNAVMRILRYLKNASGKGILFAKNVDHQSGNLVTWKSKKQNVVARSSAEAEFRGMALGLCEALWLRLLLQDLGYLSRQPIRLFCDNKVVCDIAHNPVQHDRTKHVEVDRFFIKEKLE